MGAVACAADGFLAISSLAVTTIAFGRLLAAFVAQFATVGFPDYTAAAEEDSIQGSDQEQKPKCRWRKCAAVAKLGVIGGESSSKGI